MLKIAKSAALLAVGLFLATSALAQDKAAATVNGVAIPQSRLDMQVQNIINQSQGQLKDSAELRANVLKRMIDIEVVSQAAAKKGLEKQPEYREQFELLRQEFLAKVFVADYKKNHPVSEDRLRQEYAKLKDQPGNMLYQVSLILVKTEKSAKSIARKLKKGAKFHTLAKKYSIHPSKKQGGAVGWQMPARLSRETSDALTGLKKGQVSAPVHTQDGWNLFRVENIKTLPFEQAKQSLIGIVQGQGVQAEIKALHDKAKIETFK